jgi:hypothetical protein
MFEGQIDPDIASQLTILNTEKNPILSTLFLSRPDRQVITGDEQFRWYKQGLPARRTQINNGGAAYDGTTTTIVVDDGSVFEPGSLIFAEATNERMFVQAVAGNSLTVVRGVGAPAAAAGSVANDAWLRNIGFAAGEGSSSPNAKHASATEQKNYVQTFRKSVEITGRASAMATKTQDQRAFQRQLKFEEFLQDHENALIYGAAADTGVVDSDGRKVTTTGGFIEAIVTNVDNVGGTMTRSRFEQFCEMAFGYGSGLKTGFSGNTVIDTIASFFRPNEVNTTRDPIVGLRITEVRTQYGDLRMVYHRGFKPLLAGQMLVVDQDDPLLALMHTNAPNRDGRPHLNEDIEDAGDDTAKDEWFSEVGLRWGTEENHAILKGVTGAA